MIIERFVVLCVTITIRLLRFTSNCSIHYGRNLQLQLCYGKATLSYADRGIGSIIHVYSTGHCYYDRKMFIAHTTWCIFTNVLKKEVFWTIFVTKHFYKICIHKIFSSKIIFNIFSENIIKIIVRRRIHLRIFLNIQPLL